MQQEQVQLIYVSCLYRGCTLVQSPYKLQLKYFMKIFRSIHEIMFVSARMSHLISANYSLFPDTSRPCSICCNTTTNQAEKQADYNTQSITATTNSIDTNIHTHHWSPINFTRKSFTLQPFPCVYRLRGDFKDKKLHIL